MIVQGPTPADGEVWTGDEEVIPEGAMMPGQMMPGQMMHSGEMMMPEYANGSFMDDGCGCGGGMPGGCGDGCCGVACSPSCGDCGDGCCSTYDDGFYGGGCEDGCCDRWIDPGCCFPWGIFRHCDACDNWCWSQDLTIFGGPQAFQGPLDLGLNGNFGFHYGFNYAIPFWHRMGIGAQVGGQIVHSNLSGDAGLSGDMNIGDQRTQYFLTTGFFRRAWRGGCGWQWGVVVDLLNDSYYAEVDYAQVRAEFSKHFRGGNEFGFWGAFGTTDDEVATDATGTTFVTSAVINQYNFFYRRNFTNGGAARIWVGGTDAGDGIVGGDARVPLSDRFSLQTSFNYLIPQDGSTEEGVLQESWGITTNFVWHPGRTGLVYGRSRYRPLFDVADSSIFFVDR